MKREETLLETENVRVRVMELAPGEATRWHTHSEVTDHVVALVGQIQVRIRQPDDVIDLKPGERFTIEVGRVHQVANASPTEAASYLLIQGNGHYDFNPA